MQHRVVVTGIGVVAANGVGREEFWAAIKAGRSGIKAIKSFDSSRYKCHTAGEVHVPALDTPSNRDKASKMILAAGKEAMSDAGLIEAAHKDLERMGAVVGTIHSGLQTFEKLHRCLETGNNAEIEFGQVWECALFAPSSRLARQFDLKGPLSTVSMACASGTAAIGYAASLIRHGRADVILCGGIDTVNEFIFSGFNALKALSPTKCRPFDRRRDGMVIGEGAAILILENLEHALSRKARIHSELRGYGLAGDAAHITAPDREGEGLARAIFGALQEANLDSGAVDYINLHGVGMPHTDLMECEAINKCFGQAASKIFISSTKAFTGHAMGAAGAIEAAVCVLALRDGFIPGTLDCEQPESAFNLNIITATGRQSNIKVALSTSSGFGGQNAAVIFSHPAVGDKIRKKIRVGAQKQRVAITGIGIVNPAAIGVGRYFNNLSGEEKSTIQSALSDSAIARLAEGVSADEAKTIRQMDNASRYALLAARLAMVDAGLDLSKARSEDTGIVLGTAFGALESEMQYYDGLVFLKDPLLASPMAFRNTSSNIPAAQVSIILGIKGVNATIASGPIAGANAITYSYDLLQERRARLILSGGIEGNLGALRKIPAAAKCSKGLGVLEGAAILAMERWDVSTERRGDIYCEIAGYGIASSNSDVTAAIERAMGNALEEAELNPEQIDYRGPHEGPGMREEEAAIKRLFGNRLTEYATNARPLKSCFAGRESNLLNCIRAIQRGARRAISNSIGPDGNCISIVLEDPGIPRS